MNELDEVEGLIKDAVASLEKAVKSVVELRGIARTRGYPEEEVLEEVKILKILWSLQQASSNLGI